MKKYTAAVVQAAAVPFNAQSSTDKAVRLIHEAAAKGAKVIVFPEVFISGYPKDSIFGVAVGRRTPEGRDAFREYYEGSIEVPSPVTAQLGEAAAAAQAYVVIGVIEREAGTLYCCVFFFGPDGTFLGKHRKLMPTAAERLIWGFGDGSTLPVFHTPLGNIGALICWENYMPMLRMAMFFKGVTIYCAPSADDRDTWVSSMQHIALEGRCYVLSACQFIRRSDFPEHYEVPCGNTVLMRGGSVIVGPLGKVLAGPNFEGECILTAEIDQDEVIRGKLDFDVVGHYARPDVFRLEINETPQLPVIVRRGKDT